ncbi:MAG: DUF433 domain-containing protein [Baekduia sp.]
MPNVVHLAERPLYGFAQVDHLLGLPAGTASRWIEGYERAGKTYDPVIRPAPTGELIANWGEFVETRLLAEYRDAGVPVLNMRPAIERLREELQTPYPLASAQMWLHVEGKELVRAIEEKVGLERRLRLVEVRTGQMLGWSRSVESFLKSLEWSDGDDTSDGDPTVVRLRPESDIDQVVIDPLRGFGEPVVRGVRTEVIAELMRAGESTSGIADTYELDQASVEAALRFELRRAG